jgi:sporulation protein YlmC with PRC-barrel domain
MSDTKEVEFEATEIPAQAPVFCQGEECGKVTHIVLNPTTGKFTDVVVKEDSAPHKERLVPRRHISESNSGAVKLDCSVEQLRAFSEFEKAEFIEAKLPRMLLGGPYPMVWPYVVPEKQLITVEREMIPVDEMAVRRNTVVEATDGPIGKVDELMVDEHTGRVTHLVMREGHLWGRRDVAIPIAAIERMEEERVKLRLDKRQVEELPAIPVKRRMWEEGESQEASKSPK